MNLTPTGGRDPYAAAQVAVYKNLRRGAWSIRAVDGIHKGSVVAHARHVGLIHATMHVSVKAQQRIAAGAAREVHAWIIGTLAGVALTDPQRLTYRPHERPEFYLESTGAPIWRAEAVLFTDAAYINHP